MDWGIEEAVPGEIGEKETHPNSKQKQGTEWEILWRSRFCVQSPLRADCIPIFPTASLLNSSLDY